MKYIIITGLLACAFLAYTDAVLDAQTPKPPMPSVLAYCMGQEDNELCKEIIPHD